MKPLATWSAAAIRVLRAVFVMRCIGLGCKYLWRTFETESSIYGALFFEFEWPEIWAQRIDDIGTWTMVITAAVVLLTSMVVRRSNGSEPRSRFSLSLVYLTIALLFFAAIWEFLLAGCVTYRGGEFQSGLAIAEHGLRIANPLVLLLVFWQSIGTGQSSFVMTGEWILRIATAATFASHGYKAWLAAPVFVTMVIATSQNLFEYWPEQSTVEPILKVICVADLLVAILVLVRRWPQVAFYAAIWGLVTALARTTSQPSGWPESLLRAVHVGAPLALYLQWRLSKAHPQQQISGDDEKK